MRPHQLLWLYPVFSSFNHYGNNSTEVIIKSILLPLRNGISYMSGKGRLPGARMPKDDDFMMLKYMWNLYWNIRVKPMNGSVDKMRLNWRFF